jgi:lysyl-tRNA synthetase class 1
MKIAKEVAENSKAWPIVEALRILEKIDYKTPEKGYVLFETGYGPSGFPHIGTFGEVVRTKMVMFAFGLLSDIKTRIFCVSDDMDGMRKIPDNVPNPADLKQYIGLPLTQVPDPFGTHASYGHHMNAKLRSFLDSFGFEYEFLSATECYKNGMFNEYLTKAAENYQSLMDIMIPTLGDERASTYSPFMPIDPETGVVLSDGVTRVDPETKLIHYLDKDGNEKTTGYENGGCKLQWKCDFGMRWAALDVDYEIYGKDHYPNEDVYKSICRTLDKEPPVNYFYELFLDNEGKKISKTKGNGISIDEWLKYAPTESLAYYMFVKPKTAKKLYFDVIPKCVDEYLKYARSFHGQSTEQQIENPAFYVHSGKVPEIKFDISFDLLLNLAAACSPENDDVLWGFIAKYDPQLAKGSDVLLDKMVVCAINYYNDFIKANKKYRTVSEVEKPAINLLIERLESASDTLSSEDLQNLVYSCANDTGISTKDFFVCLYQTLLGLDNGPRMGSFIKLFGIKETIVLAKEAGSR